MAVSATDAAIYKKMLGYGFTTIISSKEMKDTKTVKSLGESSLLIKGVSKTIKTEEKRKRSIF